MSTHTTATFSHETMSGNIINSAKETTNDEETDDASETDFVLKPDVDIKRQLYEIKKKHLLEQLRQLDNKIHPEYLKRVKEVEVAYEKRINLSFTYFTTEMERIEKDFIAEKEAAIKEYEEKSTQLKETLIAELQEKKRSIDAEWECMDIVYDEYNGKITTRKRRRRPYDQTPRSPQISKKVKPVKAPTPITYELEESEIDEDLRMINRHIDGRHNLI